MRTTTYKCDRCGAEDKTNMIDLDRVGIYVGGVNFRTVLEQRKNNDWCKKCRKEMGLEEKDKIIDGERQPMNPTILEKIIKTLQGKG